LQDRNTIQPEVASHETELGKPIPFTSNGVRYAPDFLLWRTAEAKCAYSETVSPVHHDPYQN